MEESRKASRASLLCLSLVAAAFVASAAVYGHLPDEIPIHWNAAGRVDGYGAKPWAPFIVPLTMAGLYVLFAVLRRASPKGYRIEPFAVAFEMVEAAVLAFLLTLSVAMLMAGLGQHVSMNRVVCIGTGLLFVVLGNYMSKFTRNFFAGIRTPWTLASEEVWLRTHRLAGKLWVAGGLVLVGFGIASSFAFEPLVGVLLVVAGVPVVYSYVIYRRLEGR